MGASTEALGRSSQVIRILQRPNSTALSLGTDNSSARSICGSRVERSTPTVELPDIPQVPDSRTIPDFRPSGVLDCGTRSLPALLIKFKTSGAGACSFQERMGWDKL